MIILVTKGKNPRGQELRKKKEAGREFPRNESIKKTVVLGSGAIKIGEAGESQNRY